MKTIYDDRLAAGVYQQTVSQQDYQYDQLGRLTQRTDPGLGSGIQVSLPTVQWSYRADGLKKETKTVSLPTNRSVTFTYDQAGRLRNQDFAKFGESWIFEGSLLAFNYNGADQLTQINRYNPDAISQTVTTNYTYDATTGRLNRLNHEVPTIFGDRHIDYRYDQDDRIASWNSVWDGTANFRYDAASQLVSTDRFDPHFGSTSNRDESYTLDSMGNRTASTLASATTGYGSGGNQTYSNGTQYQENRLQSDGVYNYTYDDEGNLVIRDKIGGGEYVTYAWDHHNRLTKVEYRASSGGTVTKRVETIYDTAGRRIQQVVDPDGDNGSATVDTDRYSYDGDKLWLQTNGSGTLQHMYLYGGLVGEVLADEALEHNASNPWRWTLADHEGTIQDIIGVNASTLSLLNHKGYDSYGRLAYEQSTTAANDVVFGYTGQEFDEATGLAHHGARYYDPRIGRFISTDPSGFSDGYNLYRYVGNNPVNAIDPSGLSMSSLGSSQSSSVFGTLGSAIGSSISSYVSSYGNVLSNVANTVGNFAYRAATIPQQQRDEIAYQGWQYGQANTKVAGIDRSIAFTQNIVNQGGRTAMSAGYQLSSLKKERSSLVSDRSLAYAAYENAAQVGYFGGEEIDFVSRATTQYASMASAALSGLRTGVKANANAIGTQAVGLVTLGTVDYAGPFAVTREDTDNAYNAASVSANIGMGAATGLVGGLIGKVGKGAAAAYNALDIGGNVVGAGRGATSAYNDGFNLQNTVQLAGGAAGLASNAAVTRSLNAPSSNPSSITPYRDPARPGYNNGATHMDHAQARSLGGTDAPSNLRPLPAETNLRKGGYEGALKSYENYLIRNGMSPKDARSVIQSEIDSMRVSPPPRPMDPRILDRLPANPADQAHPY